MTDRFALEQAVRVAAESKAAAKNRYEGAQADLDRLGADFDEAEVAYDEARAALLADVEAQR